MRRAWIHGPGGSVRRALWVVAEREIVGPKPYGFIGFGDIHGPKPYKFIGFGDIRGPKPYKFRGFGDIHGEGRSGFWPALPIAKPSIGENYRTDMAEPPAMARTGRLTHRYGISWVSAIWGGLVAALKGRN